MQKLEALEAVAGAMVLQQLVALGHPDKDILAVVVPNCLVTMVAVAAAAVKAAQASIPQQDQVSPDLLLAAAQSMQKVVAVITVVWLV
jgi:uncharacterized membrane protein